MGNKTRKGFVQVMSRATAVLLAVGAMGVVHQAGAQVVETKHNLSAYNPTNITRNNYYASGTGTTQVCVFCHTPHGATDAPAPLWQRTVNAANSYKTYGSTNASPTMDSKQGENATIGSISLACLSCHDGTQAINTMNNKPGSGNNALSGTMVEGTATSGKLTGIANLGGATGDDLQNDHPIGIKYAAGFSYTKSGNAVTNGTFVDKMFQPAKVTVINDIPVWWVEPKSGETTGRDKNDVQLFTRKEADGTTYQPYVECASCHDPHSKAELFMRVPVTGSEICLSCHDK